MLCMSVHKFFDIDEVIILNFGTDMQVLKYSTGPD